MLIKDKEGIIEKLMSPHRLMSSYGHMEMVTICKYA